MIGNRGGRHVVDWQNRELVKLLVSESTSYSEVLKRVGLTPSSNMVTLKKYIDKYDIDTSHFDPIKNRPLTRNRATAEPLANILVEHSKYASRSKLKQRLVKEELLVYQCAGCSTGGVWQGKSLTLQLEHKNGVNDDYRLINLEFLCPNCHSQTRTYAGRNKHTNK